MCSYISRLAFLFSIVLPAYSLAGETLCNARESIYFSCTVNGTGKIVSLCGNSLNDREHFWLQYRFGTAEKIELVYPRNKKKLFSESGFEVIRRRTAIDFDMEVNFNNGGWSYTVFVWPGTEGYRSGVHVARNRSDLNTTPLQCSGGLTQARYGAFSELVNIYENASQ